MMILDTAEVVTPHLSKLSAGTAHIRYLSSINPSGSKCIKPAEALAIQRVGMLLGLVHEGWGGADPKQRGHGISSADGKRDGEFCRKYATTVGAPRGAVIFFAVDYDCTAAEITARVLPYFEAVRTAFADGYYKVGVYGSGLVCEAIYKRGLAVASWLSCSHGWAGYAKWKPHANLVQSLSPKIAGMDVDTNVVVNDYPGMLFTPFEPLPAPVEPPDVAQEPSPPSPPPPPAPKPAPKPVVVAERTFWQKLAGWFRGEAWT